MNKLENLVFILGSVSWFLMLTLWVLEERLPSSLQRVIP
jgi:hypothetical protein